MGKLFPYLYDTFMRPFERKQNFKQSRQTLIDEAKGLVLEIGSGTGVNFPLYRQATQVIAIRT